MTISGYLKEREYFVIDALQTWHQHRAPNSRDCWLRKSSSQLRITALKKFIATYKITTKLMLSSFFEKAKTKKVGRLDLCCRLSLEML